MTLMKVILLLSCFVGLLEGALLNPPPPIIHPPPTPKPIDDSNDSPTLVSPPEIEILRGRDGKDGTPGRDGRDGRDGVPGPQGPIGPQGTTGNTGPQGPQGQKGSTGNTGPQGPTGPKGSTGNTGFQGPRGAPGSPGLGLQGPPGPGSGGVTYTRWGKSSCQSGTELVYEGMTAGNRYTDTGGGANHLCLPKDPDYSLPYKINNQLHGVVYAAEYEFPIKEEAINHNIPCAVCYMLYVPTRSAIIMIPAKTTCPQFWTREYYGYLMSEHAKSAHTATFECVDKDMETIPDTGANLNGALFYHNEVHCAGLPCPPYVMYKELTCVVCTQ